MLATFDKSLFRLRPSKAFSRLLAYFLFEGRPLTTKGRWFNPVVFLFLNLIKHIPFRRSGFAPVFIVGMGRSGTTVLGKVLAVHNNVAYLNEPKAMWHVAYPNDCLLYTSPSPRDQRGSRMPSSA